MMDLRQQTKVCLDEYRKTLDHFRIKRGTRIFDELEIARAIAQWKGDYEFVRLAIVGARVERQSDRFNPAEFCSLARILDPKKIEKFANLGSQSETVEEVKTYDPEVPHGNP